MSTATLKVKKIDQTNSKFFSRKYISSSNISGDSYQIFHTSFPFLSTNDVEQPKAVSSVVKLKKKAYWQDGTIRDKVGFIVTGAVRAFSIDENGSESVHIKLTNGIIYSSIGDRNDEVAMEKIKERKYISNK